MASPARRAAAFLAVAAFLAAAHPARAIDEPKEVHQEDAGLLNAVDGANQSVVTVVGFPMRYGPPRPGQKLKRLIGTAVVASNRTLITTASMALPGGTLSVLLGKGIEREARLLGVDRKSNLALFEVLDAQLTPLRRASPRSLAVGSWVAVISNVSITRPQAALGRVSGRGERIDFPYAGDIVEIDAPSYLGATGAAVLNEDGEWVAIVVGRAEPPPAPDAEGPREPARADQATPQPNSVLLALPVDQVDRIAADLAEHGAVQQAFLGVGLKVDAADTLGVRVVKVARGSPAEAAGIRVGDRILAMDGQEMKTSDEITTMVRGMRPGDDVDITVLRDAEIRAITATLGTVGAESPAAGSASEAEIRALHENLERLRDEQRRLEERLKALEPPRR
ncbi:MAG TPA: PDZ domain-containing protein [Candidatus Eisenbacteria bacterium]|nr:PDZ domain-containing protein [Candidatus Eisenbacteria bacterium]